MKYHIVIMSYCDEISYLSDCQFVMKYHICQIVMKYQIVIMSDCDEISYLSECDEISYLSDCDEMSYCHNVRLWVALSHHWCLFIFSQLVITDLYWLVNQGGGSFAFHKRGQEGNYFPSWWWLKNNEGGWHVNQSQQVNIHFIFIKWEIKFNQSKMHFNL